jgi:isopentenyldiphosphate isomerase
LWHRTANVYIVNSKNEVLLQKRSSTIRVFPNMWTMSVTLRCRLLLLNSKKN